MASELWNRTMAEVQAGRLAAALTSLRTHQRMRPRDPEVAQLLGMVMMRTGEVAQAVVQMQRAAELDPANAVHHNNLGTVMLTAKRHAEAAAAYWRAVFAEDHVILPRIQRGCNAGAHPGCGVVSAREERIFHFQRHVLDRCGLPGPSARGDRREASP